MIEVTILWDDGTSFLVTMPADDYTPAEAVEEVSDMIERGADIHGRWMDEGGVPQEQFRLAKFYVRGIRCVMTDIN
jgi:hypothetical protein